MAVAGSVSLCNRDAGGFRVR